MPKIEGNLAEALILVCEYFQRERIRFALVGALVPAILLSRDSTALRIGDRETRDADHVIHLESWEDWARVIADLEKMGFRHGREEHRLHYGSAEIDLIPYGVGTEAEEVLTWPQTGNRMNMIGFADVLQHAVPTEVAAGVTIPIVPLWVFAVLKVIAYLDRQLPRDVYDLSYVLEYYEPAGEGSRRFDVIGSPPNVTYETAGAFLLGQDIQKHSTPKAAVLVKEFVRDIHDDYHAVINAILREEKRLDSDSRRETLFRLFEAFRAGLG